MGLRSDEGGRESLRSRRRPLVCAVFRNRTNATYAVTHGLEIEGARFRTLDELFNEVSAVVVPGSDWGRNLDAFNDILRGGFEATKLRMTSSPD
jgi:hypothetical protein